MFDPCKFILAFMENWEKADLEGAMACVSDDISFTPDLISEPVVGREKVRKLWGFYMKMMQEYRMDLCHVIGTDKVVFLERVEHVLTPEAERLALPIVGVFELDDNNKIKVWRDYVESTTMPGAGESQAVLSLA